jgi:hypothetical protein
VKLKFSEIVENVFQEIKNRKTLGEIFILARKDYKNELQYHLVTQEQLDRKKAYIHSCDEFVKSCYPTDSKKDIIAVLKTFFKNTRIRTHS